MWLGQKKLSRCSRGQKNRQKNKWGIAYWRRGETLNEGKKKSEGDEDVRRKGKFLTGEMERYNLHWPEVHTGLLAFLRPSTAGANGVQTQFPLIMESNVLGAAGSLGLDHHWWCGNAFNRHFTALPCSPEVWSKDSLVSKICLCRWVTIWR